MAGTLTIDTLKASSGVLATQNGMTGICKAWAHFNGLTNTLVNSFNVSSVTKNSTGQQTFNFTTAMPNATYAVSSGIGNLVSDPIQGAARTGTYTTTSIQLGVVNPAGTVFTDCADITLIVVGN
jgi:hypothetical protein